MMANSDHKAGPRPSAPRDGSPAVSRSTPASSRPAPDDYPYDDTATALKVLAYLRERFEKREWVVIPWNLQGGPSAKVLTSEVRAALDAAVFSIEQAVRRHALPPTADA
jgi:hypothetical protein